MGEDAVDHALVDAGLAEPFRREVRVTLRIGVGLILVAPFGASPDIFIRAVSKNPASRLLFQDDTHQDISILALGHFLS